LSTRVVTGPGWSSARSELRYCGTIAERGQAPRALLGQQLNHSLGPDLRSLLHALVGLLIWVIGTWLAGVVVHRRGLRLR